MSYESQDAGGSSSALSSLLIVLLKKVLYREDEEEYWNHLLRLQNRVREHMSAMNLELVLDESEGYAYLKSREDTDESGAETKAPRLVARRQLTYPVSLMLALLRKRLAEFDAVGGETRLILSRDDIVEMVRVFTPSGSNEVLQIKHVEESINKIVGLGFFRHLKSPAGGSSSQSMYEVRRIIKSFVNAQWVSDFDEILASYQAHMNGNLIEQEITNYE